MITSIRIDDNKKTPFKYIQKIKAFKNGSEFIFKPGVNVIVGKNGSGKSTLLNMISKYMLCEKKMCSELPSEALYFPDIFDDHKPQTQIIAVIHNPALIYKLSKLDCVNFIEMTKGYLKKITGFMNKK